MGNSCCEEKLDINCELNHNFKRFHRLPTLVDDLTDRIINFIDLIGMEEINSLFEKSDRYFSESFEKDKTLLAFETLKLFDNKLKIWHGDSGRNFGKLEGDKIYELNMYLEIPLTAEAYVFFNNNLTNEKIAIFDKTLKEYHVLEYTIHDEYMCYIEKTKFFFIDKEFERLDVRIVKKINKKRFEQITISLDLTKLEKSPIFEEDKVKEEKFFKIVLGGERVYENEQKQTIVQSFLQYSVKDYYDHEILQEYFKNKKTYFYDKMMVEFAEFFLENKDNFNFHWFTKDKNKIKRIFYQNCKILKLTQFNSNKLSKVSETILKAFLITDCEESEKEEKKLNSKNPEIIQNQNSQLSGKKKQNGEIEKNDNNTHKKEDNKKEANGEIKNDKKDIVQKKLKKGDFDINIDFNNEDKKNENEKKELENEKKFDIQIEFNNNEESNNEENKNEDNKEYFDLL